MIYPEGTIPKTPVQLTDLISLAIGGCSKREFLTSIIDGRSYFDFEGIFCSMERGIENLRKRFGDAKADQLIDMLAQAKAHHDEGWRMTGGRPPPADRPKWWESKDAPTEMPGWWQRRIGNALLQDMQMVVKGRQPWAYPKELYRWALDPSLPELSEADLLNKGDDDV